MLPVASVRNKKTRKARSSRHTESRPATIVELSAVAPPHITHLCDGHGRQQPLCSSPTYYRFSGGRSAFVPYTPPGSLKAIQEPPASGPQDRGSRRRARIIPGAGRQPALPSPPAHHPTCRRPLWPRLAGTGAPRTGGPCRQQPAEFMCVHVCVHVCVFVCACASSRVCACVSTAAVARACRHRGTKGRRALLSAGCAACMRVCMQARARFGGVCI
eukprot:1161480-Pelagomonas_calceolata.AAC.24